MTTLQNILVPIDFAAASPQLLQHAVRIAAWNDAAIHILHVIPKGGNRSAATAAMKACLADADIDPATVTTNVREGNTVDCIVDEVGKSSADLLAMNAHDKGRKHLGPVAAHCVRRAPCRVLLVRDWQVEPFRNIAVCLDFTDLSERVLRNAIRVAASDKGSLELIHAMYPIDSDYRNYKADFGTKSEEEFRAATLAAMHDGIDRFLEPFADDLKTIEWKTTLLESDTPAAVITEHVREKRHDLVVIGTTGRTRTFGLHFGSNAEGLVRDTPCSVLAVKHPTGA